MQEAVNTVVTNRVSGPPCGEAPARSSIVPRDLTAELCLIALATLGLSPVHGYALRRFG